MLNIAICDDEQFCIAKIDEYLNKYFNEQPYKKFTFTNGNILLQSNVGNYDIIFLDIEMPAINGMDLANAIRDNNKKALIFYVTSHTSLVTKALHNYAFTFLPKPIIEEDFNLELDRALDEIKKRKRVLQVVCANKIVNVRINNIVYIEVHGKECEIHLIDKTSITVKQRLHTIYNELTSSTFVQCHKSYIVNLKYIIQLNKNDINIKGYDEPILMSRFYSKKTKMLLNRYISGVSLC